MTKFEFMEVCGAHMISQHQVMDDLLVKGLKHPHDLEVEELNTFLHKNY
jgi:hypothetical protein